MKSRHVSCILSMFMWAIVPSIVGINFAADETSASPILLPKKENEEKTTYKLDRNDAHPGRSSEMLVLKTQGSFSVGGSKLLRAGTYDNRKFVSFVEQEETGQSYRGDHAMVQYQIPENAVSTPLIFVHGFGGSGLCWQMCPDGREGFSTLMLRRQYPVYVMDLPGRGRAGRTTAEQPATKPIANEMFFFDIWRMGVLPAVNEGSQFPKGESALNQFFRELTPDLSDHRQDTDAIHALANKLGRAVLITHSAGGAPGWIVGSQNQHVAGIAAYEPGGFVFPESEVPQPMPCLTGTVAGISIPKKDFERLTQIPIILFFGDYIPDQPTGKLGDDNWRVRLQMAHLFVDCINQHGGNATLVELPKIGVYGNTHFLMQELNNVDLADILAAWLEKNDLK